MSDVFLIKNTAMSLSRLRRNAATIIEKKKLRRALTAELSERNNKVVDFSP
jgi:hypothetical protein